MSKKLKVSELQEFDAAEYLNTQEDVAACLTTVLEENDPALWAAAIGDIALARGMTQVAKDSGIAREALYKALRPGSEPHFESDHSCWICDKAELDHSTRVTRFGLKPRSATLPFLARAVLALFRLRISSVSSRSLPPRPMPSILTLRV